MYILDITKIIKIVAGILLIVTGIIGLRDFKKKFKHGGFLGGIIIFIVAGFFLIINQFIKLGP